MATKRKGMGEAARELLAKKRTGAEALAAIGSDAPKKAPGSAATPTPPAVPMFTTTIRIRADQAEALKSAAGKLQRERLARGEPAGKADVSDVVRAILDDWMRSRG